MAVVLERGSQAEFEHVIAAMQGDLVNLGAHLTIDSAARHAYARQIKAMADSLRTDALNGKITWQSAATQAQETRNLVMQIIRTRSTPVGRAMAQRLKANGRSLNELVALQTRRLYGNTAVFAGLNDTQKNRIYAAIVASAGKSNTAVTTAMSRMSFAGRGVLFVAVAISTYNVATAENPWSAARKEVAITGAGIAGGAAGGALAGLACGPGAPVCVTVGAFVGGALAAFGISLVW